MLSRCRRAGRCRQERSMTTALENRQTQSSSAGVREIPQPSTAAKTGQASQASKEANGADSRSEAAGAGVQCRSARPACPQKPWIGNGNEAVARAIIDIGYDAEGYYPITPSSDAGEVVSKAFAQ